MVESESVHAIVRHKETGEFLLLKRNNEKEDYPEFWEFPGGGLEDEEPSEGVLRELKEETGLKGDIVGEGGSFNWWSDFTEREIRSYSFLVEVDEKEVKLSHEHVKYEWVDLEDIFERKHFPYIDKDLKEAGVKIDRD